MNTLTKDLRIARAKARDIARIRGQAVWLHLASTLTYWIDYVPNWWFADDLKRRTEAGEIIFP